MTTAFFSEVRLVPLSCPSLSHLVHTGGRFMLSERFNSFYFFFQEAKLLIASAYRRTEKLLLDNRNKLIMVSWSFFDHTFWLHPHYFRFWFQITSLLLLFFPVGQCPVGARGGELRWYRSVARPPASWAQEDDPPSKLGGGREGQTRHRRWRTSTAFSQTRRGWDESADALISKCMLWKNDFQTAAFWSFICLNVNSSEFLRFYNPCRLLWKWTSALISDACRYCVGKKETCISECKIIIFGSIPLFFSLVSCRAILLLLL